MIKNPIKRIGNKESGYKFISTSGRKLSSKEEEYAHSLVIPHNIDNESLVIFPKGRRVVAKYKDLKGRSINKYSRKEISKNFQNKYKRNRSFLNNYENIVKKIKNKIDINTKEGQAALILYIIYDTGLRIGSDSDTKADQKAFGVSTLLNKHVSLRDGKVYLDFIGKKGIKNKAVIDNSLIYNNLFKLKSKNWSNKIFDVSNSYVRKFLHSIDDRYDIKDFRTLKAYNIAKKEIAKRKGPAPSEKVFKKWQREVVDKVAKKLGNTRAVALNDYIDPKIWNTWRKEEWGEFLPKKVQLNED